MSLLGPTWELRAVSAHLPSRLPVCLACLLVVALVPPIASADITTSLTTHASLDGPVTTSFASCSFFVKGTGLFADAGMVRIFLPQGTAPALEVGNASFQGVLNGEGLFDIIAGPITLQASYTGLFAMTDYQVDPLWELVSVPFDVQCPQAAASLTTCTVASYRPPLGTPGHDTGGLGQRFKQGQTIPVKVNVTCNAGETYAAPRILVAKSSGGNIGADQPGTTKASGYTTNILQQNGNHWQYNLDTSRLSKGLWRISIDIGEGSQELAWVNLR